jgi:hypothetical protein
MGSNAEANLKRGNQRLSNLCFDLDNLSHLDPQQSFKY